MPVDVAVADGLAVGLDVVGLGDGLGDGLGLGEGVVGEAAGVEAGTVVVGVVGAVVAGLEQAMANGTRTSVAAIIVTRIGNLLVFKVYLPK